MIEYVIELLESGQVIALLHTERDGSHTKTRPTVDGYAHVSKYRVKARATKVADNYHNARVVPTFGGYVYGSKSTVMPLQSKVNRRSAYRSM